ncbi:M14 family metallopeptidase [Lunatibacter salilacus]|uniref:hypothetical protein n=1 Tax=Lunatibacter salilacus TaxID=2483804 RepID=UPI00131E4FFB|nr:hypothetical protein [Lunatibacter salilacus]
MRKFWWIGLIFGCSVSQVAGQGDFSTLFETSKGTQTPEYADVIDYFKQLADHFEDIIMVEKGTTDSGFPLHVVLFDPQRDFDPDRWQADDRLVMFINNGIHPGEPDGIDASMMFLRDLALGKISLPPGMALAIVPVYNIGGHLNRGSYSRVNQNGPELFGFRANARNYDLNRDFVKADTKNAQSFQEIFHWLKPQVFIDTHVSNGADYQHVMTLISTQYNRLGGQLGEYLESSMEPQLYRHMEEEGFPLVPYVNAWGGKPEDGWPQFKDSGRYSSGYAALFGTLSFMPETHMLKPYPERVSSTYALFEAFLAVIEKEGKHILEMVREDRADLKQREVFALNHQLDRDMFRWIDFRGYRSGEKKSVVSGHPRLYYDRNLPFTEKVKFFHTYSPGLFIKKPQAYLIPQGWFSVIENLKRNGVFMEILAKDTSILVTQYHIADYQTSKNPYEGHYLHNNINIKSSKAYVQFRKGDFFLPMNQESNRYIVEVLEPQGEDSFFAWNFFDTILQAKEGYSAYVFEDLAAEYLSEHPELAFELEKAKNEDEAFAQNGSAQLQWVYERSPWKEKEHNRYPIFRLE